MCVFGERNGWSEVRKTFMKKVAFEKMRIEFSQAEMETQNSHRQEGDLISLESRGKDRKSQGDM